MYDPINRMKVRCLHFFYRSLCVTLSVFCVCVCVCVCVCAPWTLCLQVFEYASAQTGCPHVQLCPALIHQLACLVFVVLLINPLNRALTWSRSQLPSAALHTRHVH